MSNKSFIGQIKVKQSLVSIDKETINGKIQYILSIGKHNKNCKFTTKFEKDITKLVR